MDIWDYFQNGPQDFFFSLIFWFSFIFLNIKPLSEIGPCLLVIQLQVFANYICRWPKELWFHSVWLLILLQYWRHKLWPSSSSHANWRNFFLCCVNWALVVVAQVNLYKSDVESFIMKEKRQLPSKEESIEFVCRVLDPGLKISGKSLLKSWYLIRVVVSDRMLGCKTFGI